MRVIRFVDGEGITHHGVDRGDGTATLCLGDPFSGLRASGDTAAIHRLLPPIEPTAILCIGRNYAEHVREMEGDIPDEPCLFMKNPASVIAGGEPIVIHRCCVDPPQVDYEGELAVVIGRDARDVSIDAALGHVLGYTIANDVTARHWQKHRGGGQWVRGKSFDTFCPLGPALVTADQIADPQALRVVTTLNGAIVQDSPTGSMLLGVAELISRLSEGMTLLAGTVILTGTPPGVGAGRKPPLFMKPGDAVSVTIEPIGTLTNPVIGAA